LLKISQKHFEISAKCVGAPPGLHPAKASFPTSLLRLSANLEEGAVRKKYTKLKCNNDLAILEIPNECFYDNELEECADPYERNLMCGWEVLPAPQFPVIFHSVKGKDLRESNSPSYFNAEEAVMVRYFALF